MPGGDDLVDGAARHGLTQPHRRRVGRSAFVHQLAHVRIERKVQCTQRHLFFIRRRKFRLRVVAAPDYLARCGVPSTPEELMRMRASTTALRTAASSNAGRCAVAEETST
ncbi:MAG: hypothetical protein JWN85_3945 [Gammaproteobacteria bacterium]|nr:hypothetical protein [Gammaproteobacteria bacterium]